MEDSKIFHQEDALARHIHERYSRDYRRGLGAFFTPKPHSKRLVELVSPAVASGCVIVDPACGVGSLLLAAADLLPLGATVESTVAIWDGKLTGWDVVPEFVSIAKRRILTLAAIRHGLDPDALAAAHELTNLQIRDTMSGFPTPSENCCVLLNPPFQSIQLPEDTVWGRGKATAAASFLETTLASVPPGTLVAALLPEVLRCGTRYKKFRAQIAEIASIKKEITLGQFDDTADVHVYLALYEVGKKDKLNYKPPSRDFERISDYFDITVGAVVPHRYVEQGAWCRYITARDLPPWSSTFEPTHNLRFSGTVVEPPFVAIRRTSRPGQLRAVATVVRGVRHVAVENHIIVARPKDNTVARCVELVKYLASSEVNRDLNVSMRCRHLTTAAIKDLKWHA